MSVSFTQWLILGLLGTAAFAVEVWALVAAAKAPAGAYLRAGRLPKGAWLAITGAAALIGLSGLPTPFQVFGFGGLLSIAALVAALVFLTGVRPKVNGRSEPPGGRPTRSGGW